jgi:hypothetical protein
MSDISQAYQQSSWGKETLDDSLVYEIQDDFSGGEDSFRRPTLLDPNQSQHLLNVLVRDNYEARTRPGADAIPAANTKPVNGATGIFAMHFFWTASYQQLLCSIGASNTPKFAKFEGGAWADLSSGYVPSAANARVAMAQGVDNVLLADGSANELVAWNGSTFKQVGSDPVYDAPIGATILCFFTFRMFAAGVPTLPDTLFVSVILPSFKAKSSTYAGDWNRTTRSFRVGGGDGDAIVALAPMQQFTLCVLKANSIWLVVVNPAADSSGSGGFSASQVSSSVAEGIGCVGRDAWCNYGNDVLFFAQDGIRSVQRMEAAAGQWQLSAPLSQPIQPYIDRVNRGAWSGICAKKYKELALFFVPLDNSSTNNAVLVWNGRLQKWLGCWTNWTGNCVEVTNFNNTPQLMFGDTTGLVNAWKDNININGVQDDATYLDNTKGYPTQVSTLSFYFGEKINNKTANNVITRFTAGNATITFNIVTDLVNAETWTQTATPTGDILGVATLPFLLQSDAPTTASKGVRGLADFNEAFLQVNSTSGWFWLRSAAIGAFVNPLKEY